MKGEVVHVVTPPVKRERGYLYYMAGNSKSDGLISHISKVPMKWKAKELAQKVG